MLRQLSYLVAACSLFIGLQARADTILYPGTFDPFHEAHQVEVEYLLKTHPNDKIVILPIDTAIYTQESGGIFLPKLFDYNTRLELIRRAFLDEPRISVSSAMKTMNQDVFQGLTKNTASLGASALLIGDDVLDIWRKLPGFHEFASTHHLIVSRDPRRGEDAWLALQSSTQENIEFIQPVKTPVRSFEINKKIVSEGLDALPLPIGSLNYLHANPMLVAATISRYRSQLHKFHLSKFVARSSCQALFQTIVEQGK